MEHRRPVPTSLQIVAVLFFLYGVDSVIDVVGSFLSGVIKIDLGVLGISTFFGLRRFSTGWRTFALVWIWLSFVACAVGFFFGIFSSTPAFLQVFGVRISQVVPIWLSVAYVPILLLNLWMYRVLTRPEIRALFFAEADEDQVARRGDVVS